MPVINIADSGTTKNKYDLSIKVYHSIHKLEAGSWTLVAGYLPVPNRMTFIDLTMIDISRISE